MFTDERVVCLCVQGGMCVKVFCVFKLLIFIQISWTVHFNSGEKLKGKNLSKWVTSSVASPVVSLMGSLSLHGHCYHSPVTNYPPPAHKHQCNERMPACQNHWGCRVRRHVQSVQQLHANIWGLSSTLTARTNTRNKSWLMFRRVKSFLLVSWVKILFEFCRPCQSKHMLSQHDN